MPRGKAGSALTKAQAPCHWLDLPRLPLLRILENVHATSSVRFGSGLDAAPLPPSVELQLLCCCSAALGPDHPPLHPSTPQQMLTDRRDCIPVLLTLTAMVAVAKSSLRVPGVAHSRARDSTG